MTDAPNPAPRRIQRRRTKGWRMPPNTVYVGRPYVCGNPFVHRDANISTRMYRAWLIGSMRSLTLLDERLRCLDGKSRLIQRRMVILRDFIPALRGKNLACWCRPDKPCHADVLLELANAPLRCEAVRDA